MFKCVGLRDQLKVLNTADVGGGDAIFLWLSVFGLFP